MTKMITTIKIAMRIAKKRPKDNILKSFKSSTKSGLMGGSLDGVMGAVEAMKYYRKDLIPKAVAYKHVGNEIVCGFSSTFAGSLSSATVALVMGSMGPAALIAGMGGAVLIRSAYRKRVPSVLPDIKQKIPLKDQEELQYCHNH